MSALKSPVAVAVKSKGVTLMSGAVEKGGRVIGALPLAILFFCLITPVALVGRLCGRDELRLKRQRTGSYWVQRPQREASTDSFYNQY